MKNITASAVATPRGDLSGRGVSIDDLSVAAGLSLDGLRRLCQTLAVDMGLTPIEVQPYGSYVDLVFTSTVFLRQRQVLIRASTDAPSQETLASLQADAVDRGCVDYLLICTKPAEDASITRSEHVLGPEGFIGLCRESAMVEWRQRVPSSRPVAYQAARQRAEALKDLDTYGLAWLPTLARNRLPLALRGSPIPADEWFERVVFRVATTVFRINGLRLGSASRGKRVGDALLWWRGRLALLDCKAAYSGYRLDVNDERRLLEYARQRHAGYGDSDRIDCVVLVSSEFPTFDLEPHRFTERRRRFREAGSDLACLRADDLVDAALGLLRTGDDTRQVESVPWRRILRQGMVSKEHLISLIGPATGRP